jgi:putative transposase
MVRKAYQTDLSDAQCSYIEPHLPAPKPRGRPRVHGLREILDAVFYVLRSGCAWRACRPTTPSRPGRPSTTTSASGGSTGHLGGDQRGHPPAPARVRLGRDPRPSAGILDSRSAKSAPAWAVESEATTEEASGSKVESATSWSTRRAPCSRRRSTRPASSTATAESLCRRTLKSCSRVSVPPVWLDAGYDGKGKGKDRVEKVLGWTAEIVKRPRRWVKGYPRRRGAAALPEKGFIVLPRRWVV